ncbi:MAG: hypothetical protein ACM3MM_10105 [Acidobacteriota bacterium]
MLLDGTLLDGTVADGTVADEALFDGRLLDGTVADGTLLDGTLLDGTVTSDVGTGVGTAVGTTTEMQAGSEACSASSQFPRTSPGTPLSSGVPASRAAAMVGTATVSVARPAMIKVRCRFMGSSSLWGMPP